MMWPTKTLGEVCQFRGGGTPSKATERYWRGDIPWVSPKDMKSDVIHDSVDHISPEAMESSATSLIPKGSVLIVVRSGILARTVPIAITGRDLTINQDLKALCPHGVVSGRFLYHLLNSKMDDLRANVTRGATVHRLMTEQIRSLEFALPPVQEQQRIVGVLDKALDAIDAAKVNTEKCIQNARALFESCLQSVFTKRGEKWVEKRLDEAVDADCSLSYGIVQPGDENPNGLPVVRPTDLTAKLIEVGGLKRIDPTLADSYRRTTLRGGDLLLCVRGNTGLVSVASTSLAGANVTRGIVPLNFEPSLVLQEFGYYLLRSAAVQTQIRAKTYGAALMQINIKDLRSITLQIPSKAEQKSLTLMFNQMQDETQRLVLSYQRKLAALYQLKKSLLDRAFAGAL